LILEPIAGPPLKLMTIEPTGKTVCLGRAGTCDLVMGDPEGAVSRKHAEIAYSGETGLGPTWRITDMQSRHGTYVNGNRLTPGIPSPLLEGDRIRVGPWTLRVSLGEITNTSRIALTSDDRGSTMSLVKRIATESFAPDSQRRLELIMVCAAAIGAARTPEEVAELALDALAKGTGFPRAAMLRIVGAGEQVEVVASRGPSTSPGGPTFSRSLIQAAAEGETVVLNTGDTPAYGQSILSLGISAAVCSPVILDAAKGAAPEAFLYVDARGREGGLKAGVTNETASFCQAIARLCGLALANLHRGRLEADMKMRKAELSSARDVQRIIMPPTSGRHGAAPAEMCYHMHSVPGRLVAGDLFDFFAIDSNRAAVLLGDVMGKGVAAGMLMANVQAHLSRLLRQTADPGVALTDVNSLVAEYSRRYGSGSERGHVTLFLSLWAGVIDLSARTLRFVDAGHGYALLRNGEAPPQQFVSAGGPPLGVADGYEYTTECLPLSPGARLTLFSDGVAEQQSLAGTQFGMDAAIRLLTPVRPPEEEVKTLIDAVRAHAGLGNSAVDSPFADDVTVASIAVH